MPVQVQCPNPDCQKRTEVAEADLGRPRRCRHCGREFAPELSTIAEAAKPDSGSDPARSWSTELAIGSTLARRYRILRTLGRGGQGAVYLARDTELDRDVALKLPRFNPEDGPAAESRFLREAKTAARLDHPQICPVYDVGRLDGVPYLTMAYIEGQTLSDWFERRPRTPRTQYQAADVVRRLALTLAEAHAQGVIHRDLKPANVMVHPKRGLMIMDFGLARRIGTADASLTDSGAFLGTLIYMSPEQARDARGVGPASDVYSLGVILYELLTGRLPFDGSWAELLGQKLHGTPERPSAHRSGLDPDLEAICLKAMAREVKDRYASMTALADALRGVLEQGQGQRPPKPASRVSEPPRSPPRTPAPVATSPAARVTNSVGMTLVLIPAGEFLMGSPDSDADAIDDEKPPHRVRISRPFYLSECPVTQGQYQQVMGTNPSYFSGDGRLPVETVAWFDAVAFCNKLSEQENLAPYYHVAGQKVTILGGGGYRLPTEAEWEYACRAGTTTRYCFGDDASRLGDYAWFDENSCDQTHPVGQLAPNAWGLYDLHGNVWKWCWDGFDGRYYSQSPVDDPPGPARAPTRVIRGGSWGRPPRHVRSAYRSSRAPGARHYNMGFCVAQALSGR